MAVDLSSPGSYDAFELLRHAALDTKPIQGLTHRFYRYPARFSPQFAAAAIRHYSRPGALVLDPYMGGGTTIVEGLAQGRRLIGADINSLAVFIADVKTKVLTDDEIAGLHVWGSSVVPSLLYPRRPARLEEILCPDRTRNLTLPATRPIKKVMALALLTLDQLPTRAAKNFARCALLNAGQWALNGRRHPVTAAHFRERLTSTVREMLRGALELRSVVSGEPPTLLNVSAADLAACAEFSREKVDCVVTSPPYPGVHVLYHRWQVDGRRESPAPYWLAACSDGRGSAFYNFADRRDYAIDSYFQASLETLRSIRSVMKDGAPFIQMLAFGKPATQLPRYRQNMRLAGFEEVDPNQHRAIERVVPSRRWHATLKGDLNAAHELVLVHRAS